MLVFATAGAAEPEVPTGPVVPYYETDHLITFVDRNTARRQLGKELREAGLELFFEQADGVLAPVRPSSRSLSDPVVATALVPFLHDRVGAELDVVADRTETFLLLVTVRWDEGRLVISEARAPRGLQREGPTEAVLRERWGIGPLVEVDRPFDPLARGLLDDALSLLSPDELALVTRLSFQRMAEPTQASMDPERVFAAQYLGSTGELPQIQIYDLALQPATTFVGEPAAPHPFPLQVVLHELGHAVADAPSWTGRLLVEDIDAALARDRIAWESLAGVDTPEADGRRAALVSRMDVRETTADAVSARLRDGREVERAWLAAIGGELAPTGYGRTDPREGFAEAFALFHVDPRALERAAPRSAAWFAAGGHLQAATGAMAELDALAAPGFRQ